MIIMTKDHKSRKNQGKSYFPGVFPWLHDSNTRLSDPGPPDRSHWSHWHRRGPRWRSEGEHVYVGPGSGEAPGDGKFAMEAMDEAIAAMAH